MTTARPEATPPSEAISPPEAGPTSTQRHFLLRRVVVGVMTVAVLVLFGLRAPGAIKDTSAAFDHPDGARLPWLITAVLAEALSIACFAGVQHRVLRAGGVGMGRRPLLGLGLASVGASALLPGGLWSAGGWLATQYRRRGVVLPLILWTLLATAFSASVTVLALLLAGAALADVGDPDVLAVAGLVLVAAAVAAVVASHHLGALQRWLFARQGRAAVLARRTGEALGGVVAWRVTRRDGLFMLVYSVGNWLADAACLAAAFGVIGQPVPWRTLLFAYATSQVAGSLVPLPAGLGGVEGGLVGAFALTGMPGGALSALLIYRVVGTWLVAVVGLLALLVMSSGRARPAIPAGADSDTPPIDPHHVQLYDAQ